MHDQADQLRQLVRDTVQADQSLQPGAPLVVLSGGKCGVGTTTIATRLAMELSRLGKSTVLVDANPTQPDVASHIPSLKKNELCGTLSDVLDGSRQAIEVLQSIGNNIHLLSGRWAPKSPPDLSNQAVDRLLAELRSLGSTADVVVVDVGSGMSPWANRFWQAAQQVLLVTSPEPVAVMDSYASIKLTDTQGLDQKLRIVVNRCNKKEEARAIVARLDHTCQRFLGIQLPQGSAIAQQHPGDIEDFEQSVRLLAAEVASNTRIATQRRHLPQNSQPLAA